jgi:hypothetical protein
MYRSRTLAIDLGLEMKISDVEYQGDLSKATFYYTADGRVDFRQLIKNMAEEFKVRIEMRQIGSRQEASRLGGIGSCGRELCCSTWLTDFRSVSTSAARYQQLSLNPQKLAGQCGKLKCCLNYELDMYIETLKSFPKVDTKLRTEKGNAFHIKTDVFKRQLWYAYEGDMASGLIALAPERVREIIEMNIAGKKPVELLEYTAPVAIKEPDYSNVVGQDSLNRFEHTFNKSKNKKKKKKKPAGTNPVEGTAVATENSSRPEVQKQPVANRPVVNKPRVNPNQNPNQNKPVQPQAQAAPQLNENGEPIVRKKKKKNYKKKPNPNNPLNNENKA